MKLRLPFITRKAHQQALSKERKQSDVDHRWLLNQLQQVARRNIELESALVELGAGLPKH